MPDSTDRVPDVLERRLVTRGWHSLTPVQRAVLDARPPDTDLLVTAPTGSGKTFAFGLVCAEILLSRTGNPRIVGPYMVIITPTRELAGQVAADLTWLFGETPVRVGCVTGGVDIRAERRAIRRGFEILVASPGRLRGHILRGDVDLADAGCVVLDEADDMLDMGFREDLEAILDATPEGRRTLMFTATTTPQIEKVAERFQKDALRIDVCPPDGHARIGFRAMPVAERDAEAAIINTLRYHDAEAAMVFCNRRDRVAGLAARLAEVGFAVAALSGAMDQEARTEAISAMRAGRRRVCVATDVAARGLDLPQCSLVVHADMPKNRAALLHRSGRTGRAERSGLSIIVVRHGERRRAETLIMQAGVQVRWVPPPWPADILRRDRAWFRSDAVFRTPPSMAEEHIAEVLVAWHGAERLALAYWRCWNAERPVPQALAGPAAPGPMSAGVWFAINRGSRLGATLGQVLPMICRIGQVRRRDVWRIRIEEERTVFEVAAAAASRFAIAAACHGELREQIRRLAHPPEGMQAQKQPKQAASSRRKHA